MILTTSLPPAPGRIFISYRREETAFPAGWLYDRLAERFTDGQVFKDVDSIELGDDFVEVISSAVGSCDVLLALIGHQWLTITDEHGQRRLEDPNDFVRVEIEAALARNVRVIPILVEGARMPRATELPPSLAMLVRRQALELHPNRFDFDTGRLLRVLERTLVEVRTAERETIAAPPPTAPAKPPDTSTTGLPKAPPTRPPPRLELSATVVDFGRLPQHSQSPERTVRIANAGGGTLNAHAATKASWLTLSHQGDELVIAVDTTTVGRHEGIVAVDSDGGAATVRVTADIDPSPVPAPQPPAAATQDKAGREAETAAAQQAKTEARTKQATPTPAAPEARERTTRKVEAALGKPADAEPQTKQATPAPAEPEAEQKAAPGRVREPRSAPVPLPDGMGRGRHRQRGSTARTGDQAGYYQGDKLASWPQRTGAGLIDLLVVLVPIVIIGYVQFYIACIIGLGVGLYNSCRLDGAEGQGLGKRALHLKLVRMADKEPIGPRTAFVRNLAHSFDILTLGVGYLRPLWDPYRQTFADKVMKTVVISQGRAKPNGS
jgi:uncharacterized RDD family membrane protein YckC